MRVLGDGVTVSEQHKGHSHARNSHLQPIGIVEYCRRERIGRTAESAGAARDDKLNRTKLGELR
jgi:hypothetical protein